MRWPQPDVTPNRGEKGGSMRPFRLPNHRSHRRCWGGPPRFRRTPKSLPPPGTPLPGRRLRTALQPGPGHSAPGPPARSTRTTVTPTRRGPQAQAQERCLARPAPCCCCWPLLVRPPCCRAGRSRPAPACTCRCLGRAAPGRHTCTWHTHASSSGGGRRGAQGMCVRALQRCWPAPASPSSHPHPKTSCTHALRHTCRHACMLACVLRARI